MFVKKQLKCLHVFIIAALVTSCQSGMSLSKSKKLPPLPVVPSTIAMHTVWEDRVGHGHGAQDINLMLVEHEGTLVSVDEAGLLQVRTLPEGHVKWQEQLNKHITAGPGVGDGIVVVVTDRAKVIVRSLKDGQALWQASVSSDVLAAPVIGHGLVLVKTIDGKLYAFDTFSGDQKWYYEQEMPSLVMHKDSRPIFVDDKVVVGFADGLLTALNATTGAMMWQQPIAYAKGVSPVARMVDIAADPVSNQDRVFVVSYQGHLSAVSAQDAASIWQRRLSSYSGLAVNDTAVFATDANGEVIALDQQTGAVLWEQKALAHRHLTAPVVMNDELLVVADRGGYIHVLSIKDGHLLGNHALDHDVITTPVVPGIDSSAVSDATKTACFSGNNVFYVLNRDGKLAEVSLQCVAEPQVNRNAEASAEHHADAKAEAGMDHHADAQPAVAQTGSLVDHRQVLRHRYPI
jgi:outer membrane protein assembly factor BamB